MHEGGRVGGVIHSARTVGVGADSRVPAAEQRLPHMFPQRVGGRAHVTAPQSFHRTRGHGGRLRRVTRRATVNHEDQAQGTAGATRARQRGAITCRARTTASAHPVPPARGNASDWMRSPDFAKAFGHRRRAWLPAASPEGRSRGPVERPRLRQLARGVPLRGRRGRGRGPDRLPLTAGEH